MSTREFTVLTDVSMITCIVQRGKADGVVQAAQDAGAQGATICYGYGSGVRERLGVLGLAIDVEKEIITTLVADDTSALSYTPSGLSNGTKYYWKIVAKDSTGQSESRIMKFTLKQNGGIIPTIDSISPKFVEFGEKLLGVHVSQKGKRGQGIFNMFPFYHINVFLIFLSRNRSFSFGSK